MTAKVLIVDDNELYRAAFRRNLLVRDYEVCEAENSDQAMLVLQEEQPDVVVTDLNMRTPDEGLQLIRQARSLAPLVPMVMISAVGTFEEGAEASRLGAHRVISKSRIDEEIDSLYATIDSANEAGRRNREALAEVEALGEAEEPSPEALARLRAIAADDGLHSVVRSEAFDAIAKSTIPAGQASLDEAIAKANQRDLEAAEERLRKVLAAYDRFSDATRQELRTAEFFFERQGGDNPGKDADFSRNVGFSFCFAVENEAKASMRKRLARFLSSRDNIKLVKSLIDPKTGQIDLFYHQHLARLQQINDLEFTVDNVRQVFQRILEHESRYKPDGLKALGIMVVCFARNYEVPTRTKKMRIANPLGLRGFETDEEAVRFAKLLVALQHYRNPYIHPEISDMEKISKIRETAIECLDQISRLV